MKYCKKCDIVHNIVDCPLCAAKKEIEEWEKAQHCQHLNETKQVNVCTDCGYQ